MAIRKASSYSKKRVRPYTRTSKNKNKAYIKTVPHVKISKTTSGNAQDFNAGKFPMTIKMIAGEACQIRDNAIEACRMFLVKSMDTGAPGQYYMAIKIYPHHLVRENKSAGGMAGADRISTGMTQAFGVVIGRSAIVPAGKEIFTISCANEKGISVARDALNAIKPKLPCTSQLIFEKKQ